MSPPPNHQFYPMDFNDFQCSSCFLMKDATVHNSTTTMNTTEVKLDKAEYELLKK